MKKLDEESNSRRALLQSRQIGEQISLDRRTTQMTHREEAVIRDAYGEVRDALKDDMKDIQRRLKQTGLQGWVYRMVNGRKDREMLANYQRSLDNVNGRIAERRHMVERRAIMMQQNLQVKQDLEKTSLEKMIERPDSTLKNGFTTQAGHVLVVDALSLREGLSNGKTR